MNALPASGSNPGIPPSSLMSLLRARPAIAGAVLADFDSAFTNRPVNLQNPDLNFTRSPSESLQCQQALPVWGHVKWCTKLSNASAQGSAQSMTGACCSFAKLRSHVLDVRLPTVSAHCSRCQCQAAQTRITSKLGTGSDGNIS